MQNLIKFHRFLHKILSRNKVLTITKGHNCVVNLRKLMRNNPNLHLVKVNAYAKSDQNPSICSQAFEQKQNFDNNQRPSPCCKFVKIKV